MADDHSKAIEAAARAMKARMGLLMDAKPLHGNWESGDWFAQGSGSINLTELAEAVVQAYLSARAEGESPAKLVEREVGDEMAEGLSAPDFQTWLTAPVVKEMHRRAWDAAPEPGGEGDA